MEHYFTGIPMIDIKPETFLSLDRNLYFEKLLEDIVKDTTSATSIQKAIEYAVKNNASKVDCMRIALTIKYNEVM